MKFKTIYLILVVFLIALIFGAGAYAEDITLSNPVESGYYVTTTDITTASDDCTITGESTVMCVVEGTTTINTGFVVENGAKFFVVSGTPNNLPEDLDYDEDGMSDWWEYTYFSSIDQDAIGDYDEDGTTNLSEYLLGCDPSDSSSTPSSGLVYEYDKLGRIISIFRNP